MDSLRNIFPTDENRKLSELIAQGKAWYKNTIANLLDTSSDPLYILLEYMAEFCGQDTASPQVALLHFCLCSKLLVDAKQSDVRRNAKEWEELLNATLELVGRGIIGDSLKEKDVISARKVFALISKQIHLLIVSHLPIVFNRFSTVSRYLG